MVIYPERIHAELKRELLPIYIVGGDEVLLVEESADAIRAAARANGFDERDVMHVEKGFEWARLRDSGATMSLFAEKRLIELRIPGSKPGDAGSKALSAYVEDIPPDTCLLVICGALDASARKAKWYKRLESAGAAVVCWPIDRNKLPHWIENRLREAGVSADRDAVAALAHRVEGNLLAAKQDIDKLALLYPGETVTAEQIEEVVADNARFDVFGMVDAMMKGDAALACRMLFKLRQEGVNPVPILTILSRELRDLVAMSSGGRPVGYVFPARQKNLNNAVRRYPAVAWQALLPRAAMLDGLSKGQQPRYRPPADVWDELVDLVTKMSGAPRAVPKAL